MSAITNLFAGVPVSDLDASIDWYTRFFGRPPDFRAGDEILWEIDEHATLFIEPNAAQAGAGRVTLGVAGLDALLGRRAGQNIEHEPIETYSNGVLHVNSSSCLAGSLVGEAVDTSQRPRARMNNLVRSYIWRDRALARSTLRARDLSVSERRCLTSGRPPTR